MEWDRMRLDEMRWDEMRVLVESRGGSFKQGTLLARYVIVLHKRQLTAHILL